MVRTPCTASAALLVALTMAACSPRDENKTVGQKVDETITTAKSTTQDLKQSSKQAANDAAEAAGDAMITTKVNAALAVDDKLKAIKIDVDTSNGKVTLTGSAPDAESRDRATTLVKAVNGVTGVDNRLMISGS
jgi:hyperosmotically inducible protein